MKFFIEDFFSNCEQICSFLRIWAHLLKKSSMENFIFCAVIFAKLFIIDVWQGPMYNLAFSFELQKYKSVRKTNSIVESSQNQIYLFIYYLFIYLFIYLYQIIRDLSPGLFSCGILNLSRPNHGRTEKVKSNFYFHTSLRCLKRFDKGFKTFIKPFEAPQRSVKTKI